ncbi:MAG: 16S rRNA (guanine(966)-N(2))-methyltransferase RsmD [Treponema sp.]|jgi:16S rRNA (guanine(966)-N(2))-methyltransferase RsmD|nr:16S rRNA (guanine(966)-N(2))-methyltransferase RsmD [Treponema sp.]
MRITGGTLCGRTIKCPDGVIRPAMDRMRESLFSILGDLSEKSFLDLFAGSGILSLEAASRGAERIVLVEKDKVKINTIFENVSISPIKIQCHFIPVELFIMRNKEQFDYIFLDPPFPYKFHQDVILKCSNTNALKENGVLLMHHPAEKKLDEKIGNFIRFDRRFYGRSEVDFYTNKT